MCLVPVGQADRRHIESQNGWLWSETLQPFPWSVVGEVLGLFPFLEQQLDKENTHIAPEFMICLNKDLPEFPIWNCVLTKRIGCGALR